MRSARPRLALLARLLVLVPLLAALLDSTVASADSDYAGGPDENRDVATPGPTPADTRPVQTMATAEATTEGSMTIFAAAVARIAIDDFRYDELVLEGTASEVCAGRLLPGSGWTFNEIVSRFGGSAGTMYSCRERWDTATDPSCNGQQANPVTMPDFFSDCWSNHARGRAIDIMVGTSGGGYNSSRGRAIVNWLLATDGQGNVDANARKLGIQQILFDDRCWNSDGDRGIRTWSAMRECGVGHHDHVHLDLTIPGANGNVSYWGAAPRVAPKLDTQVLWDHNSAWRQAVSWWHFVPTDEEGVSLPARYDRAIVGDWSGDGVQDEILLWDIQTGAWIVQSWEDGDSRNARMGQFSPGYEEIVAGDWDGDGRVDDMMIWDYQTGNYVLQSWNNFAPTYRGSGRWTRGYEKLIAGDFDGDGHVNDMLVWDRATGNWVVQSFANYRPTYRGRGTFTRGYEEMIVGDWSAGGELDEMLVWNRENGLWVMQSWAGWRNTYRGSGFWSAGIDVAAPGDYDNDGRLDDLFLYDTANGRWQVWSFHRNVPSTRLSGTWLSGYDEISVGAFVD
jgi:hypothetical protein